MPNTPISQSSHHPTSFLPNARREGSLLRTFHRTLAQRLWTHFTADATEDREFFERTSTIWLHPRAVWAARSMVNSPALFDLVREQAYQDLLRSTTALPPTEYITAENEDAWTRTACGYLQDYENELKRPYIRTMSTMAIGDARTKVDAGLAVLQRVWPEAAAEFRQIARTLVIVDGGGFQYGSFQNMLGSIFVASPMLSSPQSVFEMLLHETGHQSLDLHEAFTQYLMNPDEMSSHPLRTDPRPLSGTMHATHVLGRMAVGFSLWCAEADAPADVHERRAAIVEKLSAALRILTEQARWTPHGERYFAALLAGTDEVLAATNIPA